MENIGLTKKELNNLEEIFNENYLVYKQIKNIEKKAYDIKLRKILKRLRDGHEKNLFTIMKLLDEKERFI